MVERRLFPFGMVHFHGSSLIIIIITDSHHSPLISHYSSLVTHHSSLIITTHHSSLTPHHSSLTPHHSSLIAHQISLTIITHHHSSLITQGPVGFRDIACLLPFLRWGFGRKVHAGSYSHTADVFCVGCCIHQLLAGEVLWEGVDVRSWQLLKVNSSLSR